MERELGATVFVHRDAALVAAPALLVKNQVLEQNPRAAINLIMVLPLRLQRNTEQLAELLTEENVVRSGCTMARWFLRRWRQTG